MRLNQACLRWLGAVFRLQLFRPGVLVHRFKKRATFPLVRYSRSGISGSDVSQLYSLTAVTSGRSGSNIGCRGVPSYGGF
jgi:hypothetical protein